MKKFAIIWCAQGHGDDALQSHMISEFGKEGEVWEVLRPEDENFLERVFDYSGCIISGSPKSVVDDVEDPMVKNLLAFIRAAHEKNDMAVIGLCFGSQAIAAALGGQVGRNPSGQFKLGVDPLHWTDAARESLGSALVDAPTVVVESHGECVTALPEQGVCLAASATCPNEVFAVGPRILGIQGHPEVDREFLQQKFMVYHRSLFDEAQWARVEWESRQALSPEPIIALGRRLLEEGRLQ